MNKKQFAETLVSSELLARDFGYSMSAIVEVINSAFNALANVAPNDAIELIKQLEAQKSSLEELSKARWQHIADNTNSVEQTLGDSIEFTNEGSENEWEKTN